MNLYWLWAINIEVADSKIHWIANYPWFSVTLLNKVEEDCRMKRQKRDRLERAHAQGYRAGVTGRSKELCPYQNLDTRSQWLGGWRDAIEDRNVGLFNRGQ